MAALAVIVVAPVAFEENSAVALLLPLAIVTVGAEKLPTVVLLLVTVTVTELPPEMLCASANTPPEMRPVSTMIFASGPFAEEVKLVAPTPPGEVMRNPVGAKVIVPVVVANPAAVTELVTVPVVPEAAVACT